MFQACFGKLKIRVLCYGSASASVVKNLDTNQSIVLSPLVATRKTPNGASYAGCQT